MEAKDIIEIRKKLKLSQEGFAEQIGVSKNTVYNWENGSKIPDSRAKMLRSFIYKENAEVKNLNVQVDKTFIRRKVNEIKDVPFDYFMEAEYLSIKVQAGYLAGLEDNQPIPLQKMLVPKEFEKGFYKVIEIEGDSMNDGTPRSICDGDKLLLKEVEGGNYLKKTLPYRNNLFVIVSKEGIVCKQIIAQNIEKECIICHSFNSLHTDYEICFEDIHQLFYVKKLVERKIKF